MRWCVESGAALGPEGPRRSLAGARIIQVDPLGFAVGPPLLLPERHGLFDTIDRFSARGEGVVSVCRARRNADCHVADAKPSNSVDRGDPNAGMLGDNSVEDSLHLFVCEALMRLVVEPGDLLCVGVITNNPFKNANPTRSGVLDGFANLIEGDLLVADPAKNDGGAAGHRGQHVDTVAVMERLRRVDEIAIDRQTHALDEGCQGRESLDDSAPELGLGHALRLELERRAIASSELPGGGVVVNADLHGAQEA